MHFTYWGISLMQEVLFCVGHICKYTLHHPIASYITPSHPSSPYFALYHPISSLYQPISTYLTISPYSNLSLFLSLSHPIPPYLNLSHPILPYLTLSHPISSSSLSQPTLRQLFNIFKLWPQRTMDKQRTEKYHSFGDGHILKQKGKSAASTC